MIINEQVKNFRLLFGGELWPFREARKDNVRLIGKSDGFQWGRRPCELGGDIDQIEKLARGLLAARQSVGSHRRKEQMVVQDQEPSAQ